MSDAQIVGLTQDAANLIVQKVREGADWERAATAAGVTTRTLRRWIEKGTHELQRIERGLQPLPRRQRFAQFVQDLTRAGAEWETLIISQITEAVSDEWRAGEFLLTHHPATRKRWRKEQRVELTGADGGPVDLQVSPRQRIEERLAAMRRKLESANVVDIADRKVLGE